MPRPSARLFVPVLFLSGFACQKPQEQQPSSLAAGSPTSAAVMVSTAASTTEPDSAVEKTVAAVTSDVRALQKASPADAMGKLPAHEQLVNGMLAEFESRIRAMHVQADPAWTSVIDSVRTDLARLPAMKAEALPAFLPRHLNRVMRIVACIQMVKG